MASLLGADWSEGELLCDLLLFLCGSGVLVLIGEVGEVEVKKPLIDGWYVRSLLALLDAGLPLFVGDDDLGLCGEALSSGLPNSAGRLWALFGLLEGGVLPVDVIQGEKSGLRADARALVSRLLSMFWPQRTLFAGVALPRLSVPEMTVDAVEVPLSLEAAVTSCCVGELSAGRWRASSCSSEIGWKCTSSWSIPDLPLALKSFSLAMARVTGVARSVMEPISIRVIG